MLLYRCQGKISISELSDQHIEKLPKIINNNPDSCYIQNYKKETRLLIFCDMFFTDLEQVIVEQPQTWRMSNLVSWTESKIPHQKLTSLTYLPERNEWVPSIVLMNNLRCSNKMFKNQALTVIINLIIMVLETQHWFWRSMNKTCYVQSSNISHLMTFLLFVKEMRSAVTWIWSQALSVWKQVSSPET